jgi:hypothetical protein
LEDCVQVGLFLGANAIAADLAMGHRLELQSLDQLVDRKLVWQIGLVA